MHQRLKNDFPSLCFVFTTPHLGEAGSLQQPVVEQGIGDQASVLTLKSEITFLEVSVAKQCQCLLNSFTTVAPTPSALLPRRNEGKFLYFFSG